MMRWLRKIDTEAFWRWVAWHLPKDLVYWAVIRATAEMSARKPYREVPRITALDVLGQFVR